MPDAYLAELPLAEWAALQDRFEAAFVNMGAPEDCALFHRRGPDGVDEIALFAPADRVGLLGGSTTWRRGPAEGNGWGGLVGHADSAQRLGVNIGRR